MKLIVPYLGELEAADSRLIQLAQFLGISCEPLALDKQVRQHSAFIEKAFPDPDSCLVVNPRVLHEWVTGNGLPPELGHSLVSRFRYLLVHGLDLDPFSDDTVCTLSQGRLQSVHAIEEQAPYEIAPNSKDICGSFSGLSFGPANSNNDRVLLTAEYSGIRELISIGGRPFMAAVQQDEAEILFLASNDVADLTTQVGNDPLSEYFSRLLPYVMALRYMFGEQCWRASEHHAAVIVDDPLLRENYGFLNFGSLLHLMKRHNFHTTIAFIPHNYRRNSPRITRMFRENADRLAICFHGNDHTSAELAFTDATLLNTMLCNAENRMEWHERNSGLKCDRVMVFPQGEFSVEAMKILKARNFYAAVNTVPYPTGHPVRLTIGELAQPAVLRYGGFPLFLRRPSQRIQSQDIAFDLFFGRPVLIVEHHEIFKNPDLLAQLALRINSVEPQIRWSNLESAVVNSTLRRRAADGTYHVRAYSAAVRITNDSDSTERFSIEWTHSSDYPRVEQLLQDGIPNSSFTVDEAGIRLSVKLAPGASPMFSVIYRNDYGTLKGLGFQWNAKAVLRRRLSEGRDNYLSKNQRLLTLAKVLQRRLLT